MRTPYFAVLSLATLVIAMLAAALYRRTRDASVWVGTAALYYWTLYGAWSVVIDKSGGSSGKNYHYLETKLFPVLLGGYYMETLVLYSLFVAAVLVTVLLLTPNRHANLTSQLNLDHGPIQIGRAHV